MRALLRPLPALAAALVLVASTAAAQGSAAPPFRRHAVYFEMFGNAGLFSVNYDLRVVERIALRAGAGTWSGSDFLTDEKTSITSFPLTASWLTGSGDHHLEVGGGVVAGRKKTIPRFSLPETYTFVDLAGIVGYRHQRPNGGFVFRAGLTPFYALSGGDDDFYPDEGLTISGGFSLGAAF